jgi:6-pyruvoyltetrahydropterin/6-carboxytetrahydropterin synthase
MQSIKVKHNMEMAHRLSQTPGKCEAIHGHSWWVELEIGGDVDEHGLLGGLEFGEVKKLFRDHLDRTFDHHLLLHCEDDFLRLFLGDSQHERSTHIPGCNLLPEDPTTENMAKFIGRWARQKWGLAFRYRVTVWETTVNAATWEG